MRSLMTKSSSANDKGSISSSEGSKGRKPVRVVRVVEMIAVFDVDTGLVEAT